MADLPTGGKYYTELPETTSFTDDDKIFMLNEGYGELATVNSLVDVVAQKAGAQGVVSDQFDTLKSYSKGDYCIYDNVLYKFTTDKEMGSWDDSVVEETTIGAEVSELNSDLSADTLLWQATESEWTSDNQTIDLDLSDWRYVRVVYSQNSSTATTGRHSIIAVGNTADVQMYLNFGASITSNPIIVNKVINVSITGVTGNQSTQITFETSGNTVNRESQYLGITAVWGII